MRITTWNVNGLRAVLRKNALTPVLALQPEVLCLQEIKAHPSQLPDDDQRVWSGYQAHWNPAQRAGYSGVLSLINSDSRPVRHGLGVEAFDQEGRLTQIDFEDFTLFNIYFPNGQRDHGRLTYKLDFYAELLGLCDRLHARGRQIILSGDFNTAHQEIDLRNPKENANTSGFLAVERAWIDRYLAHGFQDAYRVLYPERVEYTWWTYRMRARERGIGWRLDYFLVSNDLMPRVLEVEIHADMEGSDHCPVSLVLKDNHGGKPHRPSPESNTG